MCTISTTFIRAAPDEAAAIARTLAAFGADAVAYARASRIRIVPLGEGQRYADASAALRRLGVDVDCWPTPPSGLFVVEERSIYLRNASPMTVAHEFGHALDCALGDGVYRSGHDARIRAAFANARAFVTPYAASGIDEYFAECLRAYVGVNEPGSTWPHVSRKRFAELDPAMHAIVHELFKRDLRLPQARARRRGR